MYSGGLLWSWHRPHPAFLGRGSSFTASPSWGLAGTSGRSSLPCLTAARRSLPRLRFSAGQPFCRRRYYRLELMESAILSDLIELVSDLIILSSIRSSSSVGRAKVLKAYVNRGIPSKTLRRWFDPTLLRLNHLTPLFNQGHIDLSIIVSIQEQ